MDIIFKRNYDKNRNTREGIRDILGRINIYVCAKDKMKTLK